MVTLRQMKVNSLMCAMRKVDPPSPEDAEDHADAEPENLNPLKRFEIDILSDTIERPIFASSRQRPPQQAKPATTSENSLATFELVGVARTGARATAVLRKQPQGGSSPVSRLAIHSASGA